MKNVFYEKPCMNFVDLCDEQMVADTSGNCMPQSSQGINYDFYYDIAGDGWYHIHVKSKDCSGNNFDLHYIDNKAIPGEATDEAKSKAEDAIRTALSGGGKQQFSGALPAPDLSWS